MIWDLEPVIQRAVSDSGTWTPARSRTVLSSLGDAIEDSVVSWDEGAGETWGRVLVDASVVALVHMALPLVFIRRGWLTALGERVNVIEIDAMEDRGFRCSESALQLLSPGRQLSAALDPDDFSVDELWFATV